MLAKMKNIDVIDVGIDVSPPLGLFFFTSLLLLNSLRVDNEE